MTAPRRRQDPAASFGARTGAARYLLTGALLLCAAGCASMAARGVGGAGAPGAGAGGRPGAPTTAAAPVAPAALRPNILLAVADDASYPHFGAAANHWPSFPEEFLTYTEALRADGYKVGYTGKGWGPGVAERDGEPRQLTGEAFTRRRLERPTSGISPEDYRAQEDPRVLGHGDVFDRYPYADPTGRGFYERYMAGEKLPAGWVEPTDFESEPIPQQR